MNITPDDLRACVQSGQISEGQAASMIALAQARQGYRSGLREVDEPFELFRGFNEVFIVVGLIILGLGWFGLSAQGLGRFVVLTPSSFMRWAEVDDVLPYILQALRGAATFAMVWVLARYFVRTRRMIAPSNLLSFPAAIAGIMLAEGIGLALILWIEGQVMVPPNPERPNQMWMFVAQVGDIRLFLVALGGATGAGLYWVLFRVPLALALAGALGVISVLMGVGLAVGLPVEAPSDLLRLHGTGWLGWITLLMGAGFFAAAMRFDLSDPHRVTRRSEQAFWLHVIAATALMNPIASTLFGGGGALGMIALAVVVVIFAFIAIVIDRRSFIMAGIGYVVALVWVVSAQRVLLGLGLTMGLGLFLVLLGAKWGDIRANVLHALPDFPGKGRLQSY